MNRIKSLGVITLLVLTGCSSNATTSSAEFGYSEDNGPDTWATLSDDYALCGSGESQSPIDIEQSSASAGSDTIAFNYGDTSFEIEDTGHSIEFLDETESNSITFDDQEYKLDQIHFHNESENTIDGQHYPLEAHFVHSDEDGKNLVISVMFEVGDENIAIGENFEKVGEETEFNPSTLLPDGSDYYTFTGSLTTPPCTEDVTWVVYDQPMTISEQQLDSFTKYYSNNNRPVQDLNGRAITKD